MNESTIDLQEISKFEQHAKDWWDPDGPLKTLHDINPLRLEFILMHQSLGGKKVLDVGCGGGLLTEAMARKGANCMGVDAEKNVIEVAKSHAASQKDLTLSYHSVAIEDVQDENFDIVTCMEMLEHVQHPELVLQHCARVLKRGGWLFLSTINRSLKAYVGVILAAEYLLGLLPKQTHDYNKLIKPSELAQFVRDADLNIKDMKGMRYNPFLRTAVLTSDVSVNYLFACQKSE
ncbi:bifunctional 2-polyprenyl-6-hydroxyphenol methylase/3-demethylubiquinol 3-O-methyltransferase UbiG [Legionella israelensis]|uniref:bifunctional 2-polyprenyl-6-hydroxyphenol methylase/3-demethylubiquinol 3-O-methyltransferase UbiG n=1 Tax=Legionella israelensis TaxID=454 RepID=UPI001180B6F3|nr:bifunctional 2-polyprenyl-6-hydroxyphenol methylase/3-demethylubiquinol 3-O-methyltransferase UbiG [Legionella israelensis]QDP72624.1 bifunctional 2-polyprenyl-6-hydroxyphenol methylase/3-demethylubiquinol 3-O-methyltransferase UbiG [Legionella israelensis]